MDAEHAFWFRIFNPTIEYIPPPVKVEVPSELPKVSLVNASLKKLKFHLALFDSMLNKRTTPDARTEDVLLTVMNSMSLIGYTMNMDGKRKESCNLEAELLKSQNAFNDLLKSHTQLEKHCISLEFSIQLNQNKFQKYEYCDNQNALEIPEFFKINDLKAQLQDKDSTICKLKDIIKSLREKSKEENVNYDYCEIETKNVELENSVAKLLSKNERLCNEISHVKQVFKEKFDSTKKTCVRSKEQSDSLIDKLNLKSAKNEDLKAQIQDKVFVITSLKNDLRKLKGKEIVDIAAQTPSTHTIIPGMFKLDLEPLAPSAKKVAVTPKNNVKKVRFAEPLKSSSNIKQVESSTTSYSNTPVLSPTALKCSTSNCGSKPIGNKKNDRISRTTSRNMKNKVEVQPRKVNKKNSVVEPIYDLNVKHSLNANSEPICANCKKSMFDGVHDKCLLDFVEDVNSRAKSAKKHKKQNIWKPTGHVFTEVVQIVLWYLDSRCSKHMTGNRSQLMNFICKFLVLVRFGNDNIERIMGYGDYQLGNVTISWVYYVDGLGHNLFSVG
ncbi:hypothetical protein Tco_1365945 [Tanacetum coccineum]